jgi:hypothetical protein
MVMLDVAVMDTAINASEYVPDFILDIAKVANWLQAVGVIILIWLAFQIAFFIFNYKKRKYMKRLISDLERLEKKVDKLNKKLGNKK